jgi:hypothetical protein
MKNIIAAFVAFLIPLFLFGCIDMQNPPAQEQEEDVVVEDSVNEDADEADPILEDEDLVTRNVTYTGILEEGGVTIYQQGTHRLMLSDGRMVLLEVVDGKNFALGLYEGKLVRVNGDVAPTVEAGGTIMKVNDIGWIRREVNTEGDEEEVIRAICGEGSGCDDGFVCELGEEVGVCVSDDGEIEEESEDEAVEAVEDLEVVEEEEGSEEVEDVEDETLEEEEDDSDEPEELDDEEETTEEEPTIDHSEAIEMMVSEDYAAERWTQEYCSSHVGFCVPVHKNWYYNSFGATASVLWHLEMGAMPVENFGEGPLIVDLKSGDLSALGVTDGEVKEVGSRVIGYRSWSNSRHFEISGASEIREPIEFITSGLKGDEEEEQPAL